MWTGPISGLGAMPETVATAKKAPSSDGFKEALLRAGAELQQTQIEAHAQSEEFVRGEGNIHETMVALEKSDISLKFAVSVRNKLVEAYREIMRMA